MIHILLVSHGPLAEGVRKATEMIVGPVDHLETISLEAGMGYEDLLSQIKAKIEMIEAEDMMLIFLDLLGGSPAIACGHAIRDDKRIEVVTGLNLPMVLESIMTRSEHTGCELASLAVGWGREGIINLRENLIEHP